MNTKEKARVQAGRVSYCKRDHSTVHELPDEQRELLAKLASLSEMVEQHSVTISLLQRERLQLQTRLRLTGYRPSAQLNPRPDGDEPISAS